ncbi:MAG: gliding motility protein GldM [Prevotellaceae bacterium]|jgi:gliding motility-associated protein GldM|nr:gliding motility protein GldM [Prevotellaceae bacterium]
MAGQKLSPRQKMINMMYLVLTAMLALNVSAEVLDAFVRVEDGFQQTIGIVRLNNNQNYEDFVLAAANEPQKVGPWLKKATEVREETHKLYNTIDSLKIRLIKASEGEESLALKNGNGIKADSIAKKSDTDTGTRILVGQDNNGEGYKLEQDVIGYKNSLLALIEDDTPKDQALKNTINGLLSTEVPKTDDRNKKDWPSLQFYNSPLIATITLLSKLQLDILSSETAMLNHLFVKIGADDFKFSAVQPVIRANSEYIVQGGEYVAEIFLAAYDPNTKSTVIIGNDSPRESGEDGKVIYRVPATSPGIVDRPATIRYIGPNGEETQNFRIQFQVIKPTATVSPSKMNVLYSGIPNPLDISVGAGVPADKIRAEVKGGGTLPRQGEQFMVTPAAGSKAMSIVVSAEIDGKWQNMGTSEFRVKPVPPPTAVVDGIQGKTATKGQLASSQGLKAVPPSDFDFDAKFTITSFEVSVVNNEGYTQDEPSSGPYFNDKHRRMFGNMRNNSQVTITKIKANGPSGSMDLNDLVIRVK